MKLSYDISIDEYNKNRHTTTKVLSTASSYWHRQVHSTIYHGLKSILNLINIKSIKDLFLSVAPYQVIEPFITS